MIENAYKDEQVKLDRSEADQFMVWLKIYETLNEFEYDLVPYLDDGIPAYKLVKMESKNS